MAQSIEDSVGLTGGDASALEALGAEVENILAEEVEGSPHGSGELGQEDAAARREGYESVEDKQAQEDAALEQATDEYGRELEDAEIDEILDDIRNAQNRGADEDEDYDEDSDEYADDEAAQREDDYRTYEYDDILEELGADSRIKLKVRGEELEVPVDDLIAGYSRQEDYTRKTQEIAEERRAMADEYAGVRNAQAEYMERLAMSHKLLKMSGTEEQVRQVEQEFERAASQAAAYDAETHIQHLAAEADLLRSKIPAWQDKSVARAERDEMMNYAVETLGFDPAGLSEIADHRALLVLHKAMKYDRMNSEARGEVQAKIKKAPTLKPGQSNRRPSSAKKAARRSANTRAKLKNTGHVRDAQAAILDILGDELDD